MTDIAAFTAPSPETVRAFMTALEIKRNSTPTDEWKKFSKTSPLIRRWRFFLSLDPYTRWGLIKPRGYPGDATLMDFAYGHPSILDHVSASGPVGKHIYTETSAAKQSQSARERIDLLRTEIMSRARSGRYSALSFAAGHAREIEDLPSQIADALDSFTAIDIDPTSLQEAKVSAGSIPFVPIRRNILKEPVSDIPSSDLVYSLGLFDYLKNEYADLVLSKMLAVTAIGGRCIIANLSHDAANLGYCEAIMDWRMITRSSEDMLEIGQRASLLAQRSFNTSVKRHGCFHYLEMTDEV